MAVTLTPEEQNRLAELTDLLLMSVYTPTLEIDPAYQALVSRIGNFLLHSIRFTGFNLTTLPLEQEQFVVLSTLKQLFRTLAVARAPEYNVESEFTKIAKGDRFKHYMELVNSIQGDIDTLERRGSLTAVYSATVVLPDRQYIPSKLPDTTSPTTPTTPTTPTVPSTGG